MCIGPFLEKCKDDDDILCTCLPEKIVSSLKKELCEDDNDCKSKQCLSGFCVPDVDGIDFGKGVVSASSEKKTEDGGCIGAHLLKSFHKTQLVFDSHRKANVLCDQFGSCATPGHIVHWKSEAMMMRTYCKQIEDGCNKRVMLVNSPRY